MFDRIIQFSLQHKPIILALALLLLVFGVVVVPKMPINVFPDLNPTTVTIFTEAGTLSPEEVETLVTQPIEVSVNSANGVRRVRSYTGQGLSIVWVDFEYGNEIYHCRQVVSEKLQLVREALPGDVSPVLGPVASLMGEIMLVGISSESKETDELELREIAEWEVKRRLLALDGVAAVTMMGGNETQYQVLVSPDDLLYHNVSIGELEEALRNTNANATGGIHREGAQERLVRILGRIADENQLAKTLVPREGDLSTDPPLEVGTLAQVRVAGPTARIGAAGVSGQDAVVLSVQKQPGADTLALTDIVLSEMADIQKSLPDGVILHPDLFQQRSFIERAVHNVTEALRDGAIIVAIILFLFLLNLRTTFITLTAIPLSLVVTALVFFVMQTVFGMASLTINTMTLGGIAIAIGELVDDAIVDVENVFRRLRENRQREDPLPVGQVVFSACREVRNSIVYATAIVVLVFLPLFALGGIEGRIFTPLGVAYVVSIVASLFVAVTVTPVLCALLLPSMKSLEKPKESLLVRVIKRLEAAVLAWAFPRRWAVFSAVALFLVLALGSLPFLGRRFLPAFNEGSVTINVICATGTSLEESSRIGKMAEMLLLEIPEITKTGRRVGRAEMDDHVMAVNSNEIEAELESSDRSREEILTEIREKLGSLPGVSLAIGQPMSHRIDHVIAGVEAELAIKVFGEDLRTLRYLAEQIRDIISEVPGLVDVGVETQSLIPQLHLKLDKDKALQYRVQDKDFVESVQASLGGTVISELIRGNRLYDIVLRVGDQDRRDIKSIKQIPIRTTTGGLIPLGKIAEVYPARGPEKILREDAQRRILVRGNFSGSDPHSVVTELRKRIEQSVEIPENYYIKYGGQFESQQQASRRIGILSILSLSLMFLLLYMHFRSAAFTLQVLLNIPFAAVGAIAVIVFTSGTFSVASMVGFITLAGIASRNGIMMISHYLHLMREEGEKFDIKMVVRGTQERLVPVLMTAVTAILALSPIILAGDQPGREIIYPVAMVIASGLISSTLLDLLVTPLVFYTFGRRAVTRLLPTAIPNSNGMIL